MWEVGSGCIGTHTCSDIHVCAFLFKQGGKSQKYKWNLGQQKRSKKGWKEVADVQPGAFPIPNSLWCPQTPKCKDTGTHYVVQQELVLICFNLSSSICFLFFGKPFCLFVRSLFTDVNLQSENEGSVQPIHQPIEGIPLTCSPKDGISASKGVLTLH